MDKNMDALRLKETLDCLIFKTDNDLCQKFISEQIEAGNVSKYEILLDEKSEWACLCVWQKGNKTPISYSVKYKKELNMDVVNKPSHYTDGKIEVIDFIEDKALGFHLGNVVKYVSRAGKKDPAKTVEDLQKAKWYLERAISKLGGKTAEIALENPPGKMEDDFWETCKTKLISIVTELPNYYFTGHILDKSATLRRISGKGFKKFRFIRFPYESRRTLQIFWGGENLQEFKDPQD